MYDDAVDLYGVVAPGRNTGFWPFPVPVSPGEPRRRRYLKPKMRKFIGRKHRRHVRVYCYVCPSQVKVPRLLPVGIDIGSYVPPGWKEWKLKNGDRILLCGKCKRQKRFGGAGKNPRGSRCGKLERDNRERQNHSKRDAPANETLRCNGKSIGSDSLEVREWESRAGGIEEDRCDEERRPELEPPVVSNTL